MNEEYFGFITVRTNSTRLPNKCFLTFGDNHVLGHVIARCVEAGITPIVCTSTEIDDDKIEEYCQQNGVRVFRGSLVNKIERWNQCAIKNNVRFFHTVDCDDPFFDPDQVKESLNKLTSEELDIVSPTKISSNGAASVGYSIRTTILTSILANSWSAVRRSP